MRKDATVTTAPIPESPDLLSDLQWRGLIAQTTDEDDLRQRLTQGPVRLYCGFDPTAASLHVGNLVPLLTLRRFQQHGHVPIALVGGATGLIGDPSGRSTERTLNDDAVVSDWVDRIRTQVSSFVDLEGPAAAQVVSNLDWTEQLSAITFLREIGKHFSVNVMLAKDSIKTRLNDQGISYTEFSYMLLQANDFLELYRRHDCRLQIGGSDQWGNIVAGLDLIRRVEGTHAQQAHALTVPLVTKADGAKFGKSAAGAIWLDRGLTSPYEFFQFWLNTDDRDIEAFLKLFSMKPPAQIADLLDDHLQRPHVRGAQRALAAEMTALVHGEREAEQAQQAANALFGGGDLAVLDEHTVAAALAGAPRGAIPEPSDGHDPSIVELLVLAGLCDSKGAARRTIREGGAYLNNERVIDEAAVAPKRQLLHGRWWLLRRGKKAFGSVEITR